MRSRRDVILASMLAFLIAPVRAAQAPSLDLLQGALDPNPDLKTYTATASLTVYLHTIVPVRKTLYGRVYYRKPKREIVFDNVPEALKQFSQLAASTPSYDQLSRDYTVAGFGNNGATSTYLLTPIRQDGRVKSLQVEIGDASHLVQRLLWSYTNGDQLSFRPTYVATGSYELLDTVTISAHFPGYNADGLLRFSDYQTNVPVPL